MKNSILTFSLLLFCTFAQAGSAISRQKAQHEAYLFMKGKEQIGIDDVKSVSLPDSLSIFAFNIGEGNGYVLVSANRSEKPVLGYSTEGSFCWDALPPNAKNWMLCHKNASIATTGGKQLKNASAGVKPLCDAKWWQTTYYNAKCPVSELGDTSVTGCVATAMGIVMKRWNFPAQGTGSIAYDDKNFGSIYCDFSESVYDWQSMPDTLDSESSQNEIDAVASLLADCAKSIKSAFGNNKEGTFGRLIATKNYPTENAEYAFPTFFGYDANTIRGVIRSKYANSKWLKLIKTELDEGRPVIYNGTSKGATSGHCFVCDGYDADGYFHFNWGWGGDYNGYFSIDSMVPYQGYDFSFNQEALIGIIPPNFYFDSKVASVEQLADQVIVYPNPSTDYLSINLPECSGDIYLYLTDTEGKVVKKSRNTTIVNVADLPKGIYLLKGILRGENFSRKVEIR